MSASMLARVADLFARAEVSYAVIGAHGVHAWLEPRFTADIDVTARIDPPDLLREIAIDAPADRTLALALHPRLPAELRDALYTRAVREGDRYARNLAAVQPDLPVELLRVLAQDDWDLVRRGVAANWHTPLDLLESLAADRDENVRSMADHMLERRAAERR